LVRLAVFLCAPAFTGAFLAVEALEPADVLAEADGTAFGLGLGAVCDNPIDTTQTVKAKYRSM
jgi:hypothetical protein